MKFRLGTMMFLEYFIWGSWYVTLGTWLTSQLNFSGRQVGLAAGATAVGAMIAPFAVGLIADRFFAAQRVLAVLHGLGAVLLFLVARQTGFAPLYSLVLLYCVAFMPTLALTNSLAFRHIGDPKIEFGPVRVLGTIGWIVAGLLVGTLAWEKSRYPVMLAAGSSLLMAVYCLTLPSTPPLAQNGSARSSAFVPPQVLDLLREPSMAVFAVTSLAICVPLQFYYAFTNLFLNEEGVANAAGKMTGGQLSELCCMLLIPWFFRRLGVKYMLITGMLAWTLRYIFFAYGNVDGRLWMLWAGILLHGICYDFFFVTGQIYIDRKAPAALRGATQGLITFITYGVGMFVGSWLSGEVVEHYTSATGPPHLADHNWRAIWLFSGAASALVLLLFSFTFRESQEAPSASTGTSTSLPAELPG